MRRGTDVDRVIAELARAQNRVVTGRQLEAAGIGRSAIAHRTAIGRLYRIYRGVYLLDPREDASRITLFTAAVAACGDRSLLSHRSAAELWGLLPHENGAIDVTAVGAEPRGRPGIRRHRIRALDRRDVRRRRGVPVTAPARTIIDLSMSLQASDLEHVVATALRDGLARERELRSILDRCPTHNGAAELKAVLDLDGGPAFTRSWAERRMVSLCRQARIPVPVTNTRLHGWEVDCLWPEQRLVVEVDGYKFHGDRFAFESDRRKGAALVAAGYRVIRVTYRQLKDEPLAVIGAIALALGAQLS